MVDDSFKIGNSCAVRSEKDFYTDHFSLYLQFALNYIGDEDLCKDIVQESFIRYWKQQEDFQDELSVKAFLYKSIRNSCLNHIRHERVRSQYFNSLPADWESEDFFMESVIKEEVSDIILSEIDKLSETSRKVIFRSLDGLSNEEIAGELNVSINTVKTHKARSYIILRKRLEYLRMMVGILGGM